MTLFRFLFKKLVLSCLTSLTISYSIFFIFSLFSSLSEQLSFNKVLILSTLNALQIFVYIPSYIVLSTFLLLLINLKSKNELVIIKEYIQFRNIIVFMSPLLLFFSFFELNKDMITKKIEIFKYELIQNENISDLTIISKDKNQINSLIVLKKIDLMKNAIDEYLHYEVNDQNILKGEYSSKLELKNNNLIANDTITYEKGLIIENNTSEIIYRNIYEIINTGEKVLLIQNENYGGFHLKYVNLLIFHILVYCCFLIIFFSKIMINRKVNFLKIILLVLGLFTYNLIIPMINLEHFHFLFQFIASTILLLTFMQLRKYE